MSVIDQLSKRHIISSIVLACVLNLIVLLATRIWDIGNVTIPLIVSTCYMLVLELTVALVFRWVAKKHPKMLTSFITAVSGFRFFVAIVIMGVWYAISGRQEMMTFVIVFLFFYLTALIHHSVFFSRVSKSL